MVHTPKGRKRLHFGLAYALVGISMYMTMRLANRLRAKESVRAVGGARERLQCDCRTGVCSNSGIGFLSGKPEVDGRIAGSLLMFAFQVYLLFFQKRVSFVLLHACILYIAEHYFPLSY